MDFLVAMHGLGAALRSDGDGIQALLEYFLARPVPVCATLLDAAQSAGQITSGTQAYELMRGVGHLCGGVAIAATGLPEPPALVVSQGFGATKHDRIDRPTTASSSG